MKYIKEYLETVVKIKPLGELTTKDDELNGMSGEMVYIDGKCSDIFISHADYANWLEKQGEQNPEINDNILSRFAFYQYDDDTLYLSSVFVEEHSRKRGYGSKILKAAEEVAKTFGTSKIRLKVERNTWIEEWYKKNGYEYLSPDGEYNWLEKGLALEATENMYQI